MLPASSPVTAPVSSRPLASLAAALLAQGGALLAQDATQEAPLPFTPVESPDAIKDATRLEAVVIEADKAKTLSSPKFTTPIIDTPQTISIISKDVFAPQGAVTLSDVLRNTPGITFLAGEGGNVASGDSFFMRGFDTSGNIFVDGVRDSGAYSRDVYNLEQVEIAKGPAGADNGRGGTSGYVNLVTKTPGLASLRSATALVGSADQRRATLDISEPVAASPIQGTAVRLNALWQDSGVPGRDVVENTGWGVAPSLALGLGTPTRFTLAASYQKQDNIPDSGLPIIAVPGGALLPASVPALTSPVRQENYYGLASQDFEHVTARALTARIEHDVSADTKVSNQTKLADTDRDALTTYFQNTGITATTFAAATTPVNPATGAPPAGYTTYVPATATVTPRRYRNTTDNEILSNQTNVSTRVTTGPVAHQVSAGLELSRETQFSPTWSPTGAPSTNLYTPDVNRVATAAQTPYLAANSPYADARIDTAALYAFDTLKLGTRWQATLSGRWEHYDVDYTSLAAATPSAPAPTAVSLGASDRLFSWKTGLVYKPAPSGSLYAAYGNSFTPPGSGFALSATTGNQNNPNLDPQEARNLELGVKWDFFQSRLSTSLALYRSENLNTASTDAVSGQVTQDISQTVEGVEFGVSGKLTPEWLVFGGIGYMETEYEAAGTTSAANDGAALRFAPRLSGNLWTTYALPLGFTLGGGATYTESVLRSTANTVTVTSPTLASVPAYWIFNAMAAYAVNDRLTLRLNVNNLADETYFRLNNNGGRYYPGTPRSYTLTAELKF